MDRANSTRGYSFIEIRSVSEDERVIEGIATTPQVARDGDILVTEGIQFKLPIPFLFRHSAPLGNVTKATVSKDGIAVTIEVGAAGISDAIDEAWRMIKGKVVRGLSIGWRTLEEKYDSTIQGFRILKSEWVELSAVPVPSDPNATITSVRSADSAILAALGRKDSPVVRLTPINPPGVSGHSKEPPVKIREQITQFENKRAASEARKTQIMTNAAEEGRTLEETEQQEYDTLKGEIRKIDDHLVRLREMESDAVAAATVVDTRSAIDPDAVRAQPRHGAAITVRPNIEKGTAFVRYVGAMVQAKGNRYEALQIVKHRKQWMDQTPEVEMFIRTVIEAGDTTTSGWASQLVPSNVQLAGEFLELLRPRTLLGRIQGMRPVPFNIAVPIQSGDGTYQWVGEDAPAPVGKLTLTNATLNWAKAAGIIAITRELAMLSSPAAEGIVRSSMIKGMQLYLDQQFVGTAAAVSNVSPAGILNGIASTGVSGTTAAALQTDLGTLINKLNTNNQHTDGLVLITSTNQLTSISLMLSSLGVPLYPGVSIVPMADGSNGRIAGIPVYASNAISSKIVALVPGDVLFADGDGVEIDVSDSATIEMNSVPLSGDQSPLTTSVVMKSFWQNGLIGLRVLRFINWKVARTSAVEYLTSTAYTS